MLKKVLFTGCILALLTQGYGLPAAAEEMVISDTNSASEAIDDAINSDTSASDAAGDAINSDASASGAADDAIVSDIAAPSAVGSEMENGDQTEPEEIVLMETETTYEIPLGISDGLRKDTPIGDAAKMSMAECEQVVTEMCEANSAQSLWDRHENIASVFRRYDTDAEVWKEYSCTYADPDIYYSDDWSPGLEELRLLISGENECVEDYTDSLRFVRFLNASGVPFRTADSTPVTLSASTADETLLSIHRTQDALYVITQVTEENILSMGLIEPKNVDAEDQGADADGSDSEENEDSPSFYSCLYVLEPNTLEVQVIRITAHNEDGTSQDVIEVIFSYDHGMTEFVKTGYSELMKHLTPADAWGQEYVRSVSVTLDPGSENEKTCTIQPLKGDAISFNLPDGYELYADEAPSTVWVDNGDYSKDLTLWAAPAE